MFVVCSCFLFLWMLSPTRTIVNAPFRLLLHTAHIQVPCTASTVTYDCQYKRRCQLLQLQHHLIHQQCRTISTLQQPALRSQGTHTCKQASSRTKWGSPLHTSSPQEVCEQSIATHHQSTNPHAFCQCKSCTVYHACSTWLYACFCHF